MFQLSVQDIHPGEKAGDKERRFAGRCGAGAGR